MLIPHHLNPPILGKGYPYTPISGIAAGNYNKTPPFSWFSQEIFQRLWPNIPPSPRENGNTHAAPYAFEWEARA